MTRCYEYRHVVAFEETNLVGNVYYLNHLRWQGRCREMFLRDYAPDIIKQLQEGLALVTVRCSCDYGSELHAFDEISVRMRLASIRQNRIALSFEYYRTDGSVAEAELIAKGEHEVACMRRDGERTVATPIPESLRRALVQFE